MRNEYLFELGGENTQLAKYEAAEVLKAEGYKPEINFESELFVIFTLSKVLEDGILLEILQ